MDLDGKTILLTGGTGSFGNAFVDVVLARWPAAVIRVLSARRAQAARDAHPGRQRSGSLFHRRHS